jgi:Big-like domain-containing protein
MFLRQRSMDIGVAARLVVAALLVACGGDGGGESIEPPPPPPGGAEPVSRVDVAPTPTSVVVQGSLQLTATTYAANGAVLTGRPVTWSSANAAVATVGTSDGRVTGVSVGTVTITASSEGKQGTATVDVTPTGGPATGPVIAVTPSQTFQTMTGWEGTAQTGFYECPGGDSPTLRTQILDRLINEVGINRVRLEIRSGMENPTNWDERLANGTIDRNTWRPHRYEAINDNGDPNVINLAGFQFFDIDRNVTDIVNPLRQRLAAKGEKLYVNLNFVEFENPTYLHRDNPAEYGELMLAVFQHLQQKFGWVPDAIEVILEPDNASWPGLTIGRAIVAAGDRLAAAGFHPAFIGPSNAVMPYAITFFDEMLQAPGVTRYLTDYSYHRYGTPTQTNLQAIAQRALSRGIRTSMLEHIGSDVNDLIEDLTMGRNSAWQEYTLAFCSATGSDNGSSYLIINTSNPSAPTLATASRAKYLQQFFRYVRLNAVRVGATSASGTFIPVAFRNENGKFAVVVKATAGGSFQVAGLPAGTYGVRYTTASTFDAALADVAIGAGQNVGANIPAAGIISVFAR